MAAALATAAPRERSGQRRLLQMIRSSSQHRTLRRTAPSAVATQVETRNAPFTPEIERVKLVRGRFRFLDQKLKSVATFDQVDFRSDFRTATDLRGKITIGKTSLRDRFFLQQLQSPLLYGPDAARFFPDHRARRRW